MPKPTSNHSIHLQENPKSLNHSFLKTAPTNLFRNLSYQYRGDTALKTPHEQASRPHNSPDRTLGDEEAATSWTEEKGKKESTREGRRGCDCEAERAVCSLASESEEE